MSETPSIIIIDKKIKTQESNIDTKNVSILWQDALDNTTLQLEDLESKLFSDTIKNSNKSSKDIIKFWKNKLNTNK